MERTTLPNVATARAVASGVIVGATFLTGCWTSVRPKPPELPPPEPPVLAQTPPAPPPAPKPPPDEPPGTTIEPRVGLPEVVITEVEGAPVATMVRYIDVSERLEGCAGPYGESVEVVMVAENGRIKTSLQDTTADQAVTDCVLNALAADSSARAGPCGHSVQAGCPFPLARLRKRIATCSGGSPTLES